MENASKALIMAGSVLLSLLVIGSLVFMYQSIRGLKRTEASSEEVQKLAEYNKKIETFNKSGLYGSEIMSLANLIEDYNKRQADLQGYQPIDLEVTIDIIYGSEYWKNNKYDSISLIETYEDLEDRLNEVKETAPYKNNKTITVVKLAGMRTSELEELILKDNQYTMEEIEAMIYEYNTLKSDITEFKNKRFRIPQVEYDENNGRIIKMVFEEF